LQKLVKSLVLDGKFFGSIAEKVIFFIIRTTLFIYDIFVTAQVWLIS